MFERLRGQSRKPHIEAQRVASSPFPASLVTIGENTRDIPPIVAFMEMGYLLRTAREERRKTNPWENDRLEDLAVPVYHAASAEKGQIDEVLTEMIKNGDHRTRLIGKEIMGVINTVPFYARGGKHGQVA